MRAPSVLLLSGSAALLPRAAWGQVAQPLGRTFSVPARSVTLTVSNDLLYDTNIARGGDAAARLRGLENEDLRVLPTASLDMTLPRGRASITTRGSIGYDSYARNSRLNRERITFGAQAKLPVAFCTVAPNVAYARRQSDLIDLSIIPDVSAGSAENVQTLKEVGATLLCGPDIGIRPSAHVRYAETANSARLRRGQDVEEVRYGSELNYAQPSIGIVTIFVQRRDFSYDQRRRLAATQVPTFRITSAGVRFDRRLGAPLQLVGSISYSDLGSPVSLRGAERYDGLNWDLSATLRLGGRVLLAAETDRALAVSPGFSSDFVRQTNYVGSFTYALTPLVQVGAALSRAERNFRLVAAPRGLSITRDRVDAATLRLDYARRQVRMSVRGSYQRRASDNDLFDYEGAQATLSVSYMFKR
ncbi:hypothetical protein [Sphingomonas sp. IC4-52]|uniref:hypothetical protein n=1 Tax=Sphingomonas sp. IC4-52 TaxID=2887202 RepID=UPI001D117C6A|nr:hypothetical protein [Sphingomonas sp. IC4-52]MCC2979669.1 hypothetical protein [Sphingomonas sp. IC4-52]